MKDWKSIVSAVAPTLATALGGPFAGMATKLISEKVLGKPDGTDSELAQAFMSPDALLSLKTAEHDFEIRLQELGVEKDKLVIKDRASARMMAQATSIWPQVVLSAGFMIIFAIVMFIVFFPSAEIEPSIRDVVMVLVGAIVSNLNTIIKFWFGGSPQDGSNMDKIHNSIPSDKVNKK